ncbi:MAG: DNA polymerase III subunit gamma/tau [Mariprofundaceae bacterium]|nr:DNA polymerase III subunit gamma/tau [Mariprofundaceae bacterium]
MTKSSYQVLARRWRPQRFSELVGQDVVARTLKNALQSNTLAHAYVLTGIRGVGKTSIARLMAMAINCMARDNDGEPCNHCAACTAIAQGSHMDVLEIDAASHTGVDDMRDILDSVRYPPNALAYRVYIIDEVHMLSRNAFNALLKTLEEPPAQVMFILATTDVEKLPLTVRSRCQRFDLRRLSVVEISKQLQHIFTAEAITSEEAALRTIAMAADGSMRDALSLAERVLAYTPKNVQAIDVQEALGLLAPTLPRQLTDTVIAGDGSAGLALMQQAAEQGYSARPMLLALAELWHRVSCCRACPSLLDGIDDQIQREWISKAIDYWSHAVLDMHYQVLLHGLRDLSLVDEQCGAEMIIIRLCHLHTLVGQADSQEVEIPPEKKKKTQQAIDDERDSTTVNITPTLTIKALPPAETFGKTYENWQQVVTAYTKISPAFTAMLEHVVCTSFSDTVRLSLDTHHQRAIPLHERVEFERWLGRKVIWDTRHHNDDVESISEQRQKATKQAIQERWQYARQDPHIQGLIKAMDASLVDVSVAAIPSQN